MRAPVSPFRRRGALLACVVALFAPHAAAHAQSCTSPNSGTNTGRTCTVTVTQTGTPTVTVPELGVVSWGTNVNGGTVTLTSPAAAEYDAGSATNAQPALTVKANTAWTLYVGHRSTSGSGSNWYWGATNDATVGPQVSPVTTCPGQAVCARTTKPTGNLSVFLSSNAVSQTQSLSTQPLPSSSPPVASIGATQAITLSSLTNQARTAGRTVTVSLTTAWSYLFDTPGTYTLPLSVVLVF